MKAKEHREEHQALPWGKAPMEVVKKWDKSAEAELPEEKVCSVSASTFDREGRRVERPHWLIKEQPVTLYLNGRELVTLLCAGHHLDELAVGFLYAEGFLGRPADIAALEVNEKEGKVNAAIHGDVSLTEQLWMKRTITSGCGKGSLFYYSLDALLSRPVSGAVRFSARQILDRVDDLNRLSEIYRRTHGVHNSALANGDGIMLFRNGVEYIKGEIEKGKIAK